MLPHGTRDPCDTRYARQKGSPYKVAPETSSARASTAVFSGGTNTRQVVVSQIPYLVRTFIYTLTYVQHTKLSKFKGTLLLLSPLVRLLRETLYLYDTPLLCPMLPGDHHILEVIALQLSVGVMVCHVPSLTCV